MKQVIPFKKDLVFKTTIEEITSISLEHNLKQTTEDVISGEFIVKGEYKPKGLGAVLNDFSYAVPFDIAIADIYNLDDVKIDIEDFYYEIKEDNILKINIEVLVTGLKEREKQVILENPKEELREVAVEKLENREEVVEEKSIAPEDEIKTVFDSFDDNLETFSTYSVYITKEGDTLESILTRYEKSKEDLEAYNDLSEIKAGTKIIIPASFNNE